jgi:hypothetical protein
LRAALDFAARRLDPGGLDGVLDGPVSSLLSHFSLSFSEAEDGCNIIEYDVVVKDNSTFTTSTQSPASGLSARPLAAELWTPPCCPQRLLVVGFGASCAGRAHGARQEHLHDRVLRVGGFFVWYTEEEGSYITDYFSSRIS